MSILYLFLRSLHYAPSDIHPNLLQKSNSRATNHTQRVPYMESETFNWDNYARYKKLSVAFTNVFEWIENLVSVITYNQPFAQSIFAA